MCDCIHYYFFWLFVPKMPFKAENAFKCMCTVQSKLLFVADYAYITIATFSFSLV